MDAKTFLYEINTSLYKIVNIDKKSKLWVDIFDWSLTIVGWGRRRVSVG